MKDRLDNLLVAKGLAPHQQKAAALIGAGQVLVNKERIDKAGCQIATSAEISLKKKESPFVSRGGLKLAKGLTFFTIDPKNYTCADIGSSTGGFTDCLLQNGAKKVYSIDVGYGQLDWQLRQDKRVVVLERTNARYLSKEEIPEEIQLAVIDAAFISIKLLIPLFLFLFAKQKVNIISLIKPQFEVAKGKIGKGGVIYDPEIHTEVINDIENFVYQYGLNHQGITESPILGPKGNKEFLIHITNKEPA